MDKDNIYLAARAAASRRDRLFANRDRAAEALHVSREALFDYETGRTLPPCDVVQWMIEVYGAPELKARHLRAACPLMAETAPDGCELRRAALGWITGLHDAMELSVAFARIVRDGEITADELGDAARIRAQAVELIRTMSETVSALDGAIRQTEG